VRRPSRERKTYPESCTGTGGAGVTRTSRIRSPQSGQVTTGSAQTPLGSSPNITGVFILGIFTRRATWLGAWLGVLGGSAILVYAAFFTEIHEFLYAAIGVVATFVVGYVASLAVPGRTRDLGGLTLYTQQPKKQ